MVTIARILFSTFGLPVPDICPEPAPAERFPTLFPPARKRRPPAPCSPAAVDPVRLAVGGTIIAPPDKVRKP